jgi:hypothetical protein
VPFAKQALSSAPAARRDCQMHSFERRTKSMFASMVLNAGIGTITPRRSSLTGRQRSGIAARRKSGSISTTILALTPLKMPAHFGACYSEPTALVKIYAKQLMPSRVNAIRGRARKRSADGSRCGARHSSTITSWRPDAICLGVRSHLPSQSHCRHPVKQAVLFQIETGRLSDHGEHVFVVGILSRGAPRG